MFDVINYLLYNSGHGRHVSAPGRSFGLTPEKTPPRRLARKANGHKVISFPGELYDRFVRLRDARSEKVGIPLSWPEFFSILARDVEGKKA